jgi:hypothetical protein
MAGCHQPSIDFTVFLIDDPPAHNVRLRFVELDRRRFVPKIFTSTRNLSKKFPFLNFARPGPASPGSLSYAIHCLADRSDVPAGQQELVPRTVSNAAARSKGRCRKLTSVSGH